MPKKVKKEEIKKASIIKRVLAYIIDSLIITLVVSYPFNNYLKSMNITLKFTDLFTTRLTSDLYIIFFTIAILSLIYFVALEYYLKQTIGKIIMKIKIISLKKEFKISQVILRNISKVVDILLFIDVIYMLLSPEKER
ncbi:RDD family protein, partial [Candidatus Pacearchaeota archaeon]|nr:RDD family protein [Candidatus Pacearchaeota archaeon]